MSPLRQRPGDQPLPASNDRPDVQSMVIADITARRELGIQRYGTALQPHNGRDSLRDAYEEALDLACYLRQVLAERDDELTDEQVAELRTRFEEAARTGRSQLIVDPPRQDWVLVKGWHESGTIDGVYGPYTKQRAYWLLDGMLDGSTHNWTIAHMQAGPADAVGQEPG